MTDPESTIGVLDDKRPPITYTVQIKQWWDGRIEILVQNVGDDPESRRRVAAALQAGALLIDRSEDHHGH